LRGKTPTPEVSKETPLRRWSQRSRLGSDDCEGQIITMVEFGRARIDCAKEIEGAG